MTGRLSRYGLYETSCELLAVPSSMINSGGLPAGGVKITSLAHQHTKRERPPLADSPVLHQIQQILRGFGTRPLKRNGIRQNISNQTPGTGLHWLGVEHQQTEATFACAGVIVEQRHNFSGKDSVGSDERDYRGQKRTCCTRNTLARNWRTAFSVIRERRKKRHCRRGENGAQDAPR